MIKTQFKMQIFVLKTLLEEQLQPFSCEVFFCVFQKKINYIRQFNSYITNQGSIYLENVHCVFVLAQSFFSAIFLTVEFLIIYRKPFDFINMLSPCWTPKSTMTACDILMVLLLITFRQSTLLVDFFLEFPVFKSSAPSYCYKVGSSSMEGNHPRNY